LILDAPDQGRFLWPRFLERNFGIAPDRKHDLWIESPQRLANGKAESAKPLSPDRPFALRNSLTESELSGAVPSVTVHRNPEIKEVWTATAEAGTGIRQTLQLNSPSQVKRLIVVVDGSEGMKPYAAEVAQALAQLPAGLDLSLLIAHDDRKVLDDNPRPVTPELIAEMRARLTRAQFDGGQDNLPTLEKAWDLASAVENGRVLWIHGAEAVLLSPESGVRQRLERNLMRTRLLELQTEPGPDRVLEKLDGVAALKHVPRLGSVSSDLSRVFGEWSGKIQAWGLERVRTADPGVGVRVGRNIERLWARDEALRLSASHNHEEATLVAAKNQLVTPLTGAVVLETKEQYERHGLTPADPKTVPAVPEPGILSLLGLGIFAFLMAKRRRKHAV
jgi:hypothetical protein